MPIPLPPRPSLKVPLALALLLGTLGTSRTGFAQWPQARLNSLSRLGGRAGESVDVTLNGTDLEGAHTLWFDHPGLRALHLKGTTFRVVCAADAPIGQHDVRVVGTYGLTNPRTFVVGDRPESVESEPNNAPAQANSIALNSVINGGVTATDIDVFAFEGKAGQRVLIDLAAERLESRLDATLHILNAEGRELAECRDAQGVDPFLDFTLPADGRYFLKIHDVIYRGSPDHNYRLTLSDGPHLDAVLPTVAAPGVATEFTLIGRNLGGTLVPDLRIDDRPIERKTITLTPPSGPIDPLSPSLGYFPAQAAPRLGFEFAMPSPTGTSNPLFIAQATDPVIAEVEPNNDDAHAQQVSIPCDLSGTFDAPGDTDVYRFRASKGQVWWFEASAERLGSPADPTFVIQQVVVNGPPKDLATAEDTPDRGGGARFSLASVDAALRWQAPEDGTYQVVISDLYASQRGDARLVYRLNIRPERPDFRLFVVPASTTLVDALTVAAGGRASASVIAWRTDGFNGPIRIEPSELPPGVRCEPVTIAAGQTVAPIVFEAGPTAKPGVGLVQLVGRSRFGDRKDELHYYAGATHLGPEITRQALAGHMVWPPAAPVTPTTIAPARVARGLVLAVVEPRPLALSASPSRLAVAQGHQLNLDLAVTRRDGFAEAVTVTAADLPANVVNATTTVAKTDSSGTLSLFVAKNVAPGEYTFLVRGTGPYPFSKDPKAKTKPNITLNEPANAVTLVVRPAPLALTLNNKGGALKVGGTLEVDVTIARQNGFAGGLTLSLVAPSTLKLSAPAVVVAEGQPTAKLLVQAAPDSPAGAAAAVAIRAVATVRGESIEVDEPLTLTLGK